MERLDERIALLARFANRIERLFRRWTIRARAREIIAAENRFDRVERQLVQQNFRRAVADAHFVLEPGIEIEFVRVAALDAVHAARVFRLGAAKERRSASPRSGIEVGHFEREQMRVLRVRNARLPAEIKAGHRDAVRRIGVRGDRHAAGFGDHAVRSQRVRRRAHLTAALIEFFGGHAQREQEMFEFAHGRLGRKDREEMKAERRGEFKTGQHENSLAQPPILFQALALVVVQSFEALERFEELDFFVQPRIAARGVVIGESDDVEIAFCGSFQKIEIGYVGLLVVRRGRRMEVQIHPVPLALRCFLTLNHGGSFLWIGKWRVADSEWQKPIAIRHCRPPFAGRKDHWRENLRDNIARGSSLIQCEPHAQTHA